MCEICHGDFPSYLETKIIQKTKTTTLCPNCCAVEIANDRLTIEAGPFISEISGKEGAVKVISGNDSYVLTPKEALNLLNHGLTPNQYDKLTETHDPNEYLLHEDFYVDSTAWQPTNTELYEKECEKEYVKTILSPNEGLEL